MTWSAVVEFPAVDATAALKAAWMSAAEADGDWWDHDLDAPRLDSLAEVTPGELLEALAACRVSDAVPTTTATGPIPSPSPSPSPAPVSGSESVSASDADPAWIDPNPGPAPAELAAWVRRQWWSAPIRADVRALMTLAPGPELVAALTAIGRQPVCPAYHGHPDPAVEATDPTPAPGSTPGHPCACQLVVAAGWQAVIGWAEVHAAGAMVDICGPEPVEVTPGFARARITDPARVELAAALRISPDSTYGPLHTSRDLHAQPALAAAAADGTLFSASRRAILRQTANLPDHARTQVINHIVTTAHNRRRRDRRPWTPSEARKAVRDAIHRLASDAAGQARAHARKGRRVTLTPDTDGMAWLNAHLADVDAHRIYNRLTAAAAAAKADDPDDNRTADQRRADLITALLLGHTDHHDTTNPNPDSNAPNPDSNAPNPNPDCDAPDPDCDAHQPDTPTGPSPATGTPTGSPTETPADTGTGSIPITARPDISVIVTLATLLALTNDPAHVPGLGPIPANIARDLAADGTWRLWITDPTTGHVTTTGSRTYTPSAALARLIRAREPHCRMPGCARQALNCDLDHTIPYPGEPGTVEQNLGPLCRGHHNLKTHHGYHLTNHNGPNPGPDPSPDPGPDTDPTTDQGTTLSWTWTFPSGLTHTDQPDPPLPGP
ncbi:MAG: hypothetical protein QG597_2118 [Actinomycetota bacterium]|nr:hypothetical protein [Actinomycetota bacterium]